MSKKELDRMKELIEKKKNKKKNESIIPPKKKIGHPHDPQTHQKHGRPLSK